jgi:hypothetical protein
MVDGKHCPKCQSDIGYWAVFSAGLPNRIWCPHCQSRLEYRNTMGLTILVVLLAIGLSAFAVFQVLSLPPGDVVDRILILCAIIFGVWIPIELLLTRYLRHHRQLVCFDSSNDPPSMNQDQSLNW